MAELKYLLDQKEIGGQVEICLERAFKKEELFASTTHPREKEVIERLVKRELQKSKQLTVFERFPLPSSDGFAILKALSAASKLYWQGKKIAIDPFTTLTFFSKREGELILGYWSSAHSSGLIHESQMVCIGDPSWVLNHGIIQPFSDEIDHRELKSLLLGPIRVLEKQIADPLPFLRLSDRHGAFANLGFNYGHLGEVLAEEFPIASWRKEGAERDWEKDLLETDFIKKIVGNTRYYCPMDKVAKSLTFLLEMGWPVFDAQGRRVVRQKGEVRGLEVDREQILISAKFQYQEHEADLKSVMGAFNRKERFIELSNTHVALLDHSALEQQWGDLSEQEIVAEGIRIKPSHVGLLDQFLEGAGEKRAPLLEILQKYQEGEEISLSPSFQGTLFPYQQKGFSWLCRLGSQNLSGLLADEMGLGKTVQLLAFFSSVDVKPLLVVVPTSLLFNWRHEIEKFLPGTSVYVHAGRERCLDLNHSIILVSYALLRLDAHLFEGVEFGCVVLDEGQTIKNPESQIAAVCCRLQAKTRFVITGTPIENRPEDLWSLFHFLLPDLLGERKEFQSQLLAGGSDARYIERIKRKVRPFILRRTKAEVAIELPEKLEQTVLIEMTEAQQALYDEWLQRTRGGLLKKIDLEGGGGHQMEILEAILRLRQLCCHPLLVDGAIEEDPYLLSGKYQRLLEDIEEVVEENRRYLFTVSSRKCFA